MSAILFGSIGTIVDMSADGSGQQPDTHERKARPGVLTLIERAKNEGVRLALLTTTPPSTVSEMIDSLGAGVRDSFEFVLDATVIDQGSLGSAAYRAALESLALDPSQALAIVQDSDGVKAARAAELWTAAFPGAESSLSDCTDADAVIDVLDHETTTTLIDRLH